MPGQKIIKLQSKILCQFLITEPYLEAIPQTLILISIFFKVRQPQQRSYSSGKMLDESYLIYGKEWYQIVQAYITITSSLFSGATGVANFLRLGPFTLIPNDMFSRGNILLIMNVGTVLVIKGTTVALVMLSVSNGVYLPSVCFWLLFNVFPQLVLVSVHIKKNRSHYLSIKI